MTPLVLIDDLCVFLTDIVKDFRLTSGKTAISPPKIHKGYLPIDAAGNTDPAFPYVIVRLTKVTDDKTSTARVLILVGTQSEDNAGWLDCWNVGQRIRQGLLMNRILSRRFSLQMPLELEAPEAEQPYPEAVCWLTTTWIIPQPQNRLEEGVYGEEIPGSGKI